MLWFFRQDRPRQVFPLLALLTGLSSGVLRAETIDYMADATLARTMVHVVATAARPVPLAEIMALVEAESGLRFAYSAGEVSLGTQVTLVSDGPMSLARLFAAVSAQHDLVFEHGDGRIAVRTKRADSLTNRADGMAPPARPERRINPERETAKRETPDRFALTVSSDTLASEVAGIADDAKLSRVKKEKQISAAVRSAVLSATSEIVSAAEVIDRAVELADIAAGAGPKFAETIATAAAFAPTVIGIKGGPAQVRAAAYAGARSPRKPVESGGQATEPLTATRPRAEESPTTSYRVAEFSTPASPVSAYTPPATSVSESSSTTAAIPNLPSLTPASFEAASAVAAATAAPSPDGVLMMDKLSVQGTSTRGSLADLRSERTKATVSIDFLTADQLAKYSAGDLSEVVFRIPGVSVANGQFAVVRGLSDRFLSTTLQGVKLPTPDPEKQAVQLDLLPASAVEAVVVAKNFESSQWAESSGGNMDVRTRTIPTEGLLKVSFGLKMNSNSADGGPDYAIRGSTNERFGFGARSRLPPGTSDPTWQYVPTHRNSFPMGNKLSAEFARSFSFGDQQLGLLLTAFSEAGYKSKTGRKQGYLAQAGRPPTPAVPATPTRPAIPADPGRPSDFETRLPTAPNGVSDYEESESENVLSVSAGVGYRFSADHEFKFTGVFVQSGIDFSLISRTALYLDPVTKLPTPISGLTGFAGAEDNAFFKTREYFRERNLTVLQLAGRHILSGLGDIKVNWGAQRGTSYQNESPYIDANFGTPLDSLNKSYLVIGGSDAPQSLKVVWADNQEEQKAARLDADWPFRLWGKQKSILSAGAAFDSTNRKTTGSFTDYSIRSGGTTTAATPNGIFAKTVNPNTGSITTPPTTAAREIQAYYASANFALGDNLKLVAGARYEDFSLATTGSGRWGGNLTSTNFYSINPAKGILGIGTDFNPGFASQKWYPGAGLIFGPWQTLTFRLHYSRTSGRPSLREVSPFFNKSIETDNLVVGNPALQPSDVTNYDFRVEWAPTRTDFFALSVFRKDIERPIEKLIFSQTTQAAGDATESWINNPGAALVRGFEFEFRHQLKSWSEWLRDFSLSGNFTRIEATVDEIPQVYGALLGVYQDPTKIPKSRRLFDQPEYIANLDLTWSYRRWGTSATLAAFAISDVLVGTGKPFFFDLYTRAHTRLDFIFNQQLSARLKLKLTVKNFADPARGLIYDREAISVLVERDTYHIGREYGATLTYDF